MAKAAVGALIMAILIKMFVFDVVIAEGHSMEPAIRSGALLVVNRLQYGLKLPGGQRFLIRWADPRPGEVVVFYSPGGQLAVKRCGDGAGAVGDVFLLLGDNSLQSLDSRSYGPVRGDDIIGKVLGIR
jgi:signal peptidase I